jgi:hypothetical protein
MIIDIIIIRKIILDVFCAESAYAEYSSASSNRPSIKRNAVWPEFKNVKED